MGIRITKATKDDVKKVLTYIEELASYENLSKTLQVTEELLIEHVFEKERATVLFIFDDDVDEEIGFAIYYYTFSTFLGKSNLFLSDMYIKEEARGKGYGKQILAYLAMHALRRGCDRFEWNCLNWVKPSIAFYKNLGAKPLSDWVEFRLDGEELKQLANEFVGEGVKYD
jgi:GNAT superfamily N-acetyltransferase